MRFRTERRTIETESGPMSVHLLMPKGQGPFPGVLWCHGGGYITGGAWMVSMSAARTLAARNRAVVLCPEYRLAPQNPYPCALRDCLAALRYLYDNAEALHVDRDCLIVGGESAGGGLAAALCLYNRDHDRLPLRLQLPLYPMIDCRDTDSSRDNHAPVWNTRRNHDAWGKYLKDTKEPIPIYASPAQAADLSDLPPLYTFVCVGEPFYQETVDYVRRLQQAGVYAALDIYPGNVHAFDMLLPLGKKSREARTRLSQMVSELVAQTEEQGNGEED